jgi:hypothetical protein
LLPNGRFFPWFFPVFLVAMKTPGLQILPRICFMAVSAPSEQLLTEFLDAMGVAPVMAFQERRPPAD